MQKKDAPKKTKHVIGQPLSIPEQYACDLYLSGHSRPTALTKAKELYPDFELAPMTARNQAARWFDILHRKSYILANLTARQNINEFLVKQTIEELSHLAFSNIADYLEFDGDTITIKNSSEISAEQLAAISEISKTVSQLGSKFKFKLHSKVDALKLLGTHLGLFNADLNDPALMAGKIGAEIVKALSREKNGDSK